MADRLPFDRMDSKSALDLESEEALERFRSRGFLWIRLRNNSSENSCRDVTKQITSFLRTFHNQNPACLTRKWSVENSGSSQREGDLSVDAVLEEKQNLERFYCSTIISRRKDGDSLANLLSELLNPFWEADDTISPPILGGAKHNGGAWLFLGSNQDIFEAGKDDTQPPVPKKPKRIAGAPLIGRAEHVDDVQHSGTWHVQLSGKKTWFLRPNPDSDDWGEDGIPILREYLGKKYDNHPHVQVEQSDSGQVRLCCHVEEGDLFVLNTKAWYHRTELPVDKNWSISLARDFNLPIPQVLCPKNVTQGEVILEEDDIPDQFPTAENSEDAHNCALAEVALEEELKEATDIDGTDEQAEPETSIVLVALRDIRKGEPLLLEKAEEGSDDDDEEENAPESIDPRVIAKKDWRKGEAVLTGDAMPEDLPLSRDANCQLIEENGELLMQAIRDIPEGDVFTIAPDEGDDLEDYEEVEVELGQGEITRKTS